MELIIALVGMGLSMALILRSVEHIAASSPSSLPGGSPLIIPFCPLSFSPRPVVSGMRYYRKPSFADVSDSFHWDDVSLLVSEEATDAAICSTERKMSAMDRPIPTSAIINSIRESHLSGTIHRGTYLWCRHTVSPSLCYSWHKYHSY